MGAINAALEAPDGVVSKRVDAPYRSGPSKTWLKSKNPASDAVRRERQNALVVMLDIAALIAGLSTHHGKPPPLDAASARNHCSPKITSPFSTTSTHCYTSVR